MKLATFVAPDGEPAIGSVDTQSQTILDLQRAHIAGFGQSCPQFESMLTLMAADDAALDLARDLAEQRDSSQHQMPLAEIKLLAPVPLPAQIRDFSSYEKHLRGAPAGMSVLKARLNGDVVPEISSIKVQPADVYYRQPIYYISNRFNVIGHDTDVTWPDYCEYLDFELEFGVFIGRKGKDIPAKQARRHIFGYCIFNDFSARDPQLREMSGFMGPAKGKSFDTGNAIGPWIVTADEIPDPAALRVNVKVNGEVWAASTTGNMLHSFEDMIAFVSRSETLHPGEFFGSGTIGGCCGLEMDRWLKPGDVVELDVERLGVLRNRVARG